MGPFVPELISDQLNLVVALVLGIGFGVALEQAGFSSSRRLAGVFYGYDFTVLRVFFTAAVTAMSGVLLLGYFGYLDTDAIFVNPTWLVPAIVGGAIMGVGFVLGGYCPGTSVCAAAIGKIDAMFFVGGGLLGVLAFGELYPLYKGFYESTSLGPVKVFDSLGISQGLFAFLLIAMAVGAFAVTTVIEKRVNKKGAPSLGFATRNHVIAALSIVALGVILLFLPDRKAHLIGKVSDPVYLSAHPAKIMSVDELAFRMVDHEPRITLIDIRTPGAYSRFSLPGSVNIPIGDCFGKEWITLLSQRHAKKVILADSEPQEHAGLLMLQELGYENLAILQGGLNEFNATILNPSVVVPANARWDSDVSRFRESARKDILAMIKKNKQGGPREVKKQKKIQGGC
jgi:rhodanese-related sulfurtransferase